MVLADLSIYNNVVPGSLSVVSRQYGDFNEQIPYPDSLWGESNPMLSIESIDSQVSIYPTNGTINGINTKGLLEGAIELCTFNSWNSFRNMDIMFRVKTRGNASFGGSSVGVGDSFEGYYWLLSGSTFNFRKRKANTTTTIGSFTLPGTPSHLNSSGYYKKYRVEFWVVAGLLWSRFHIWNNENIEVVSAPISDNGNDFSDSTVEVALNFVNGGTNTWQLEGWKGFKKI